MTWQQQALQLLKTAEQTDDIAGAWIPALKALDVARDNAADGADGMQRFPEGILGIRTYPDTAALRAKIQEA